MNLQLKFLVVCCLFGASCLSGGMIFAQNKQDIGQVKKNIEQVQKSLQQKQQAKKDTTRTLTQTQATLQKSQRELAQLNVQHKEAWTQLKRYRQELEKLASDIHVRQDRLAQMLFLQNKQPQQDALVLLLKNEDPNQKGRDLTYLRFLAQANQKAISELKTQQEQLMLNEQQVNEQIIAIENVMRQKQAILKQVYGKNLQVLNEHNQIVRGIEQENSKLAQLRRNEQRLAQLVKSLSKPKQQSNKSKTSSEQNTELDDVSSQREPEIKGFTQAKGRLRRPVSGNVTGRYGSAQPDGGIWKGLFISSATGQSVKSVYAGKVIYTGPLQGYGNTVIVDQGEGYFAVYGSLADINVRSGSEIKGGQSLGSTGRHESGQDGLYFEIRHIRQPVNPSAWIN